MIIGVAVTIAFYKFRKKFSGKKKGSKVGAKSGANSAQHKCDDCSAECMLRDSANSLSPENAGFCIKNEMNKV